MENKEQQYLDKFSKKVFLEAKKEEVSFDFTSQVMSKLEANYKEKIMYKPLVPKVVWLVILSALIFWLGYLLKNYFVGASGWFSALRFNNPFSDFELSKSARYTIILFAIMVCIQVPLLKYYFNKRLGV